jgi:hypothetical protein
METIQQVTETAIAEISDAKSADTITQPEATDDPKVFENNEGKKIRIESYTSAEITPEILNGAARFYRKIFAGSFGQFCAYPSTGEAIAPHDVFKTPKNELQPLEVLDSYDPQEYPVHPQTGEHAILWHDPETTLANFTHKLNKDAHITIFRDIENNEVAGLIFGRACSLEEAFKTEEWENPLYYSGKRPEGILRNYADFEKRINQAWAQINMPPMNPETIVYVWNCVATRPDLRGPEFLTKLTKPFFDSIPQEMKDNLRIVGEAKVGSKAHFLFTKVGNAVGVPGILKKEETVEKNDPVIILATLHNAAELFSKSPEELFMLSMAALAQDQ